MRGLVTFCVVLGVVSLAGPKLVTLYREARTQRSQTVQVPVGGRAPPAVPAATADGELRIQVAPDGHYYLVAAVNGRDVHFVVDTGASTVALRETDARTAGLHIIGSDYSLPVSTANGRTYAAPVTLDSVAVGGIEVDGIQAAVLPDDKLQISLLGGTFLNRLQRFEASRGTLLFQN
ncbi:aspartyl protease family protein [Faunimonas pinastri]|uniref:Aspartyl protease family protein n=1 Tax=Faunimonas pinastri TaxID=1855383 RepID=A0A1H9HIQ6_9HYPH|nr:TIGR02281 family clan AA aspartic protease [Faunimonas pinastri]SEQ62231.1 aspartyl protease family protein [Faunimonas pinastri]